MRRFVFWRGIRRLVGARGRENGILADFGALAVFCAKTSATSLWLFGVFLKSMTRAFEWCAAWRLLARKDDVRRRAQAPIHSFSALTGFCECDDEITVSRVLLFFSDLIRLRSQVFIAFCHMDRRR